MTRQTIQILVLLMTLIGCTNEHPVDNENIKKKSTEITDTISNTKDYKNYVSDTVKKIIDELNLCQYAEEWNKNVPDLFDCYDKDVSDIRLIKKGDIDYENFIFQSPGGSGGGTIIIYSKKNGNYKIVQDDYGYLIEVLKTTTNGYFDLIIWHREQKAGGEDALYQWNGEKYVKTKVTKDYSKE